MWQPAPIFDAHLHVIDYRFPLVANRGYRPDEFTSGAYLAAVKSLGITGGAVVSGSFQAFDQMYFAAALQMLGPILKRYANFADSICMLNCSFETTNRGR